MRSWLRKVHPGVGGAAITIVVLACIIGILSQELAARSLDAAITVCDRNTAEINLAIERWFFSNGAWPADDLSGISCDPRYFPSGLPTCPVNGERFIVDPRRHRIVQHRH